MLNPQFTRPVKPVSFAGQDALAAFLDQCGIDYHGWGVQDEEGNVVSWEERFEDLWKEIENRDTLLTLGYADGDSSQKRLIRNIRTITARVIYDRKRSTDAVGQAFVLREKKRVGRKLIPRRFADSSLSEKMRFGIEEADDEPPRNALRRALMEELGIHVPEVYFEGALLTPYPAATRKNQYDAGQVGFLASQVVTTEHGLELDPRECTRYPGLFNRNELFHTIWHMPKEFYQAKGYETRDYLSRWAQTFVPSKESTPAQ